MKKNLLFVLVMMVIVATMGLVGAGCGDDEDDEDLDGDEDGDEDDDDDTTDDDDDTTEPECTDHDGCAIPQSCNTEGACEMLCVDGKYNEDCSGVHDMTTLRYGECQEVPCTSDDDCLGLGDCDDPAKSSDKNFSCDANAGFCKRG